MDNQHRESDAIERSGVTGFSLLEIGGEGKLEGEVRVKALLTLRSRLICCRTLTRLVGGMARAQ